MRKSKKVFFTVFYFAGFFMKICYKTVWGETQSGKLKDRNKTGNILLP
jgi:hypothetical protein